MTKPRMQLPEPLAGLLRSEMDICIYEANLGETDTMIAQRYLIEQVLVIDIAAELGWTRGTVSDHLKRIISKVSDTALRLNLHKSNKNPS